MSGLLRNTWVIVAICGVVLASAFGGWWYWTHRGPQLDDLIREAIANAELTTAYSQEVVTETQIEDRHIRVAGTYVLDDTNNRYSSLATTELALPDGTVHSFDLHTIIIGEDMYTRVLSRSPALNLTVPSGGEWKRFKTTAIPPEYREIATPRPPIDNLTLLRKGGDYLTIKEGRRDEEREGEQLARYTFDLSSLAFTEKLGPVSMIAERVGVHGTVDVWVRKSDKQIRFIRLANHPYSSETKVTTSPLPAIVEPQ
jgi:hypothetical protein